MNNANWYSSSENPFQPLSDLIASHEAWLMHQILHYAKQQGYAAYTSTLAEAWRVSICGLSTPLIQAIAENFGIQELSPHLPKMPDISSGFGIVEAQRHRSRGITIELFLGLFKYYRQSYLDLIEIGEFQPEQYQKYRLFIHRFFDRIELGICGEWISQNTNKSIVELQEENRNLANIKNKYLTLFESLSDPVFLLDRKNQIVNLNSAAARTFTDLTVPGSLYYSLDPIQLELPWLNEQVLNFMGTDQLEQRYETELLTQRGKRWFEVKLNRMLDVSGKFSGIIAVYTDISDRYQADRQLRQSEQRIKNIITTHIHGLVILNQNGKIVFANPVAEDLLNQKKEDLLGTYLVVDTSGKTTEILLEKSGQVPVILQVKAVEIPWEEEMAHLVSLIDITRLKQAQEKLQILYQASEQSPASIVITDAQGNIEYVNPKFEKITGYTAAEVQGKNPRVLKSGHTSDQEYKIMWETIASGQEWYGEFKNRRKNGHVFWEHASISPIKNLEGKITHFVAVKEDITQRKQNEALLEYHANYDTLTALPNRILVRDRLQQAITQAEQKENKVAILLLDLDHFKQINESLGHELGDRLLQEVAQRLLLCIQKSHTLARLGGDEFLILLPNLASLYDPENIAHNILHAFKTPFDVQGEEIFISVSIGITLYPDDGLNGTMLMKHADSAMYEAKNEGRNTFRFFTPQINQQVQTRTLVQKHLHHAISQNELYMVYQPFIELTSGLVVGAEALMRWSNPELGQVSPDQFIPIAEETGLIVDLGDWALDQACAEVVKWQGLRPSHLWVAVNLSPRQFRESNFIKQILATIERHQISTDCLELEITERLLMEDIPHAKELINQLHDHQIRLAIDDFGTGYSSLSSLKRYPFQVLKIDRSFIREIPEDPEAVSLVTTILAMAHGLGLKSIAEGIETAEQQAFLQRLGCDYGQGYYFSKPLRADGFRDYLREDRE
ncbi:EAL domain-containing protein [Roseofilum reptotaenium CS-1145]|uniref:GGDEF domain-containing protein n=1 Tax=Roseofilum reptotaenium AO1-A TaxID=1925591 RepID=A0A1L9QRH9_9CYAN|nr:EAL domain-containing protein [Roseofilum reptotaenium]MDB9515425.1 EAL domain-containing protein [Roseofilum reptotaenium CS-1145]OJJ25305.1 hypothetical protein BI308_11795 [Roseofilum reptotaenium AO1-A]